MKDEDKDDLFAQTERLVLGVVKDARKRRKVEGKDGAPDRWIAPDIADRVKAADAALRFLQIKAKLVPEEQESEFAKRVRDLHGDSEGEGDADTPVTGACPTYN